VEDTAYKLVYDASTAGMDLGLILRLLFGAVFGTALIVYAARKRSMATLAIATVGTCGLVLMGGIAIANTNYQRWRCKHWLRTGDYSVVEGAVSQFHPMPYSGHDSERFTVEGVSFKYSDYDQSQGGFNNTSSHGGPIREGKRVRIAYREGRILKLWVEKTGGNE